MTNLKADTLARYEAKTATARAQGSQHKEFSDPTTGDMLYLRAILHPTSKKASRDLTRQLITLVCERKIVTASEICEELGCSENPVLSRLKILRHNGYIRRESKRYYIATHRMQVMYKHYIDRVCG